MGIRSLNKIILALIVAASFLLQPACNVLKPTANEPYTNPEAGSFLVHRVKSGENIQIIAKIYNISIDEIQKINRKDVNKVVEGDFVRVPTTNTSVKVNVKDSISTKVPDQVPPGIASNEFSIGLLLPFYLDKNFSDDLYDVHPSSMKALQFYEGAQLALKELKKDSVKITLKAFDSSKKNKVRTLLSKPEVVENNVLIGDFSNSVISEVLEVVKENNNNMILLSAFRANILTYQPQVALAQPSSASQCRLMAQYVKSHFNNADLYIAFQDVKREKDLAAIFKEELDSAKLFSHKEMSGSENLIEASDDEMKKLFSMMDSTKQNVVFITSSKEPFVNSFLRRLYTRPEWDITVVGLPTWEEFNSIDTEILNHFNLHIFSTDYVDYSDPFIKKFRKEFIIEYNTDPLPSAFEGYYLTKYVADMYGNYGGNYIEFLEKRPSKNFLFKSVSENGGCENARFSVLSYRNYEFVKVN